MGVRINDNLTKKERYDKRHPGRAKAMYACWVAAHKDKVKMYKAKYRAAHPDKVKAYQAKYRVSHRDNLKASNTKYYAEHPEVMSEQARRRRALKVSAPVSDLTVVQWKGRITEYQGLCSYCLQPMIRFTQDHMIPLTRGGSHTLSNVVPCCQSCNSRKGTKTLLEFVAATQGYF